MILCNIFVCHFLYDNNPYNVNKCNKLLLEQLIPQHVYVYATNPSPLPAVYTADCCVCTKLCALRNPRPSSSYQLPGPPRRQSEHTSIRQRHHSHTLTLKQGEYDGDDYDGQMSGHHLGVKFPCTCLTDE